MAPAYVLPVPHVHANINLYIQSRSERSEHVLDLYVSIQFV